MYSEGAKSWLKHLDFMIIDGITLFIAYFLSFYLRHDSKEIFADNNYRNLFIVILLVDLLLCVLANTYSNVLRRGVTAELKNTVLHTISIIGFTMFVLFYVKMSAYFSRQVVITLGIFYSVILFVLKCIWKIIISRYIKKQKTTSLVIVTSINDAKEIIEDIRKNDFNTYAIRGLILIEPGFVGQTIEGVSVICDTKEMIDHLCTKWVDEILFNVPLSYSIPDSVLETLNQMGIVCHVTTMRKFGETKIQQSIGRIGSNCVLTNSIRTVSLYQVMLKRIIDILGGLVGCLITCILCLIVGPMIYFTDKGPIFFTQTRIGKNGKKFKIAKFRSMYMDAEERKKELMEKNKVSDGKLFKMDEDPRIIGSKILEDGTYKKGIGNFIRDYSIDEFPQFWNVLKGDMSLVGTRPPVEGEWILYTPENRGRMATKPGITGLWQVSGRSNITDFDEVVRLDTEYINTWTVASDVKIVLKTIWVVFKREGAV